MRQFFLLVSVLAFFLPSCANSSDVGAFSVSSKKAEVIINDIPFQTDNYYRIPYTVKLWEYEKEELVLERVQVLDNSTKEVLMTIEKADFPKIYKNPLGSNPYFAEDTITSYYISIQLPIPLENRKPLRIFHRFTFTDTEERQTVLVEGAAFSPRFDETPLVIASPLKGRNLLLVNQSTMAYHFYVLMFVDGKIYRGERFAFDSLQFNDDFSSYFDGDPKLNESYFNYGETLYAVADGTVVRIRDGRPENNGDAKDVTINSLDELGGNYLVLDIGGGHYAFYAHCVPGSFQVKEGDVVVEGQPLALLGNSGNSDAPHLHFEITDGPDILFSYGVPFVLKGYTRLGEIESGPASPTAFSNSMMEEKTVVAIP